MAKLICKLLPCKKEATILLVAAMLSRDYIKEHTDDRFLTTNGLMSLATDIYKGHIKVFAVFAGGFPCGFEFGWLNPDGLFEHHAFWNRGVDVLPCLKLAKKKAEKYYGDKLKGFVSYIPRCNRAAIYLAKRFGCKTVNNKIKADFLKDGEYYPCAAYVIGVGE